MTHYRCGSCDREMAPAARCPHCEAEQDPSLMEIADIDRSIAEMKARDAAITREQRQIAATMQAALFQREILRHNAIMRLRQAARPRRLLRRKARQSATPSTDTSQTANTEQEPGVEAASTPHAGLAGADASFRIPRQAGSAVRGRAGKARPDVDGPENLPEASTREVQNILLILGALLLGISAVVFAAVAISSMAPLSRVAILLIATVVMLLGPIPLARRGLTATAETVAAVGLLLIPLTGHSLWTTEPVQTSHLSPTLFTGLVFVVAATVAAIHATLTGLRMSRYATVLATQPVVPLLAYDHIWGPGGWAAALTMLAAVNLLLIRLTDGTGPDWLSDRKNTVTITAMPPSRRASRRPETAPEETDAILTPVEVISPLRAPAPVAGLRPLVAALYGTAVVLSLGYAGIALLRAGTLAAVVLDAVVLLLAAGMGLIGAINLRQPMLVEAAAAICTLAAIGALSRVAAVALPGRALLLTALVIALTGVAVRAVPQAARRGPQLAAAVALTLSGLVVAFGALRAGSAAVRAALPAWSADLEAYPVVLAEAAGPTGRQLSASALLLTVAALASLPTQIRREFAVACAALTALALPASLGLDWNVAPWPPILVAVAIGLAGLSAQTDRAARAHLLGAALVGLVGAGAALSRPEITAAVLFVLTGTGILMMAAARLRIGTAASNVLVKWAAAAAALALPGAIASIVATAVPVDPTPTPASLRVATVPILAASSLAACVTLGYAAVVQVSRRRTCWPLTLGAALGGLTVAAAAFSAPGTTAADAWIGVLLLVAAVLLVLAPFMDAEDHGYRVFDGADLAAAAATTALVGTLARITAILAPGAQLTVAAALALVVASAARAMPLRWRRGPILGVALGGAVIGLIAAYPVLINGARTLAISVPVWGADLADWPTGGEGELTWQAPVALLLLAAAAAALLPEPWRYDVSGGCVLLATIGVPVAMGMPWWAPLLLGGVVAAVFAVRTVDVLDPRAGNSRAAVAAAIALYCVAIGLAHPLATAAALGLITVIGALVAGLTVTGETITSPNQPEWPAPKPARPVASDAMPQHLIQIGGVATIGALFALPGALAALAAGLHQPTEVILGTALGASSVTVLGLAVLRHRIAHLLPYATIGIAAGATMTALAAIPTGLPAGLLAAAAALLGVLAELIRATTLPSPDDHFDDYQSMWSPRMWPENPAAGALAASALPTVLATVFVAPALIAALVEPYQALSGIWQGPPPQLVTPPSGDGAQMLTALLLTLAAALAASGLAGGRSTRAVPVVLPGAAVTLLIAPASLGQGWPSAVLAALAVFAISMLGLALIPPPPITDPGRSLRVARAAVFVIGLAAGGAGLAGSLATRELTLATLAGAVTVGAAAALAGATERGRILGWIFASIMAQLFVFTAGFAAGLAPMWSAFGVLAVGAALLVVAARLPRLQRSQAGLEATAVEWSGYAAGLVALALAFDSPQHLAALLAAWGAVLGMAAARPGRPLAERRILFWSMVSCEIVAWWLLLRVAEVALPEAYTLPFAGLALLVGRLELRHHPELGSWLSHGPALVAAFLPTLAIVLATDSSPVRQVLLLLGGVATLIFGSVSRLQAPVIVGAVVTAITAVHALFALGPWLVLIPAGVVLLILGASNERRRRTQERFQAALRTLR